jgi:integrase
MKRERYKSGQKALTPAQVKQLLSVIDNLSDEVLLKLSISAGIRRHDVCNILVNNINFDESYVEFSEKKKGGKIKRTYLSTDVITTIKKWINIKPSGNKYLFSGRGTKPISDKTAYNILQKYLKRAGLPARPFHALRATAYKIAQSKGWTVRQASEHIGDSTRVAEEHYGTPSTEEMKDKAINNPII